MSILRPPIIHVVHDDADRPDCYRRLVRDAVRAKDIGRVIELAYDMAEKLEHAKEQVEHILDVMHREQQPNPDCRNITVPKHWGPFLTMDSGGSD